MKVELVAVTTGEGKYAKLNQEEITSAIARHGVIKEDNGKLVRYLMNEKHWSPLDMVNFVFEIETSRAIGRQILRHASIKFQEHSQRYSESSMFEDFDLRKEHPTNRQSSTEVVSSIYVGCLMSSRMSSSEEKYKPLSDKIIKLMDDISNIYDEGIDMGIAKECMRMILPECTTTTMTANGTLRSWLSFLNVRQDHHAQLEIQQISTLIGESLEKKMPKVFSQIEWRKGMFM